MRLQVPNYKIFSNSGLVKHCPSTTHTLLPNVLALSQHDISRRKKNPSRTPQLVLCTEDEGHSIENASPVLCTLFVRDE